MKILNLYAGIGGNRKLWGNFLINQVSQILNCGRGMGKDENLEDLYKLKGFDLSNIQGIDKMKTIRNCVEPEIGLHIFNCAFKIKQHTLQ